MPSTTSSSGATTSTSSVGSTFPGGTTAIREFDDQRQWMHERYLERAAASGVPWLLVEGSPAARLQESSSAVDQVLAGR